MDWKWKGTRTEHNYSIRLYGGTHSCSAVPRSAEHLMTRVLVHYVFLSCSPLSTQDRPYLACPTTHRSGALILSKGHRVVVVSKKESLPSLYFTK